MDKQIVRLSVSGAALGVEAVIASHARELVLAGHLGLVLVSSALALAWCAWELGDALCDLASHS